MKGMGQGPGVWGLLACERERGLGAAGMDDSLFLCLQVAGGCWVMPSLLLLLFSLVLLLLGPAP